MNTLCDPSNPHKQLSLVVSRTSGGSPHIVATGSYLTEKEQDNLAEVAFAVDDAFHGKGLGSLLLERAEAIAQLVHQTSEEIREERSPARGRITLGVPPIGGRLVIAPFVERFRKAWPQVTLHMREGVTSSLQEWLVDKRIDVAILHNPPHLEALDIKPILLERMLVIGPPKQHIEERQHPATFRIRNLGELPLILPNMAHNNRRLVEQAAVEHGVRLRITHDSNPFGGENNRRISAYFKQQMDLVGIRVDIRAGDTATFIKRVYGDYDFDTTSTQAFGLSDPTIGVQRFYWSKNITPGVAFSNGSGYSNPDVDKLLEAAQSEIDPAKRAGLFGEFQRIIMRDLPILPLVDGQYFAVRSVLIRCS